MINKLNKKGSVYGVAILMATIVIVAFTIVITKYIITEFYTAWNAEIFPEVTNATATKMITAQNYVVGGFSVFDYGITILFIVLLIGLIISSFMIPTHPIFMVINFVGIFFLVFLGMVMNNTYGEFIAGGDATLMTTADQFPIMNWIIAYLPFIAAIAIFIVTIVVYTRSSGGGGY